MPFKEQIQADLANTFFNMNEFAEKHILDGQSITCIVDNDRLFNVKNEGTYIGEVLLYVPFEQLSKKLSIDSTIVFDSELMIVNDAYEVSGMYQITLEKLVGKFIHKIVIQQQVAGTDEDGFQTNTWQPFYTLLAYMRNLTGSESVSDHAEIGKVTTLFKINYIAGVTRKMRISYGGQFYNIKYVNDIEGKHDYLDLICEVIN